MHITNCEDNNWAPVIAGILAFVIWSMAAVFIIHIAPSSLALKIMQQRVDQEQVFKCEQVNGRAVK